MMATRADELVAAARWNDQRSDEAALDGDVRTSHRLAAQRERLREMLDWSYGGGGPRDKG